MMATTLERHQFCGALKDEARRCRRGDNWHGPVQAAWHWTLVVGLAAVSLQAWQRGPAIVAAPVYAAVVFLIGGRQRALSGLLHEAVHRAFMRSHGAGAVLATLLGGYPMLQSYTGYRASHLRDHHGHLGDPQIDPDYQQYLRNGLCGENLSPATLRRYLARMFGLRATVAYLAYLARHRIVVTDEERWERVVRIGVLAGAAALITAGGWLPVLALYWLVPMITTQVWIGSFAELLEHYPIIETEPRVDLYLTWNRHYGPITRFLLGEQEGEGFHLVHHLFPRTPIWRLRHLHEILREDPEYAARPCFAGVGDALTTIVRALPEPAPARVAAAVR